MMDPNHASSVLALLQLRPLVALVLAVFSGYCLIQILGRKRNIPPGPFAWPLIGNLLHLGSAAHVTLSKLTEEYGSIFRIYFSTSLCVVLNDYDSIKKAFSNDAFSGRLRGTLIDYFLGNQGLITSDGALWKEHRRFALSTLRDLGMGKTWLQERILEEVQYIINTLEKENGAPYNPEHLITTGVSNIICVAVFGKRFAHDDKDFEKLLRLLKQCLKGFGQANPMVLFPSLRHLPYFREQFRRMKEEDRIFFEFIIKLIEEAQKDGYFHEDGSSDYVNAFAREAKKQLDAGNDNSTFGNDQLKISVANMFIAGTETTSNTLLMGLLYMVENPDIARKVQKELDTVADRKEMIKIEHRGQLPYTEATILELLRVAAVVPLGIFHRTTEKTVLNGYDLPADTLVISNIYAVNRNPEVFPNPEKFDPKRFLDEEGKFVKSQRVISFSVGKRACLGENLAQMELFLALTNILHNFDLLIPKGTAVSSKDIHVGMTLSPYPYKLIFQKRNS